MYFSSSKKHDSFCLYFRQLVSLENGLPTIVQDLEEIYNSAVAEDEYQKMSGDDQHDIVIARIESFLKLMNFDEPEGPRVKSSKNTTKYKQVFVKKFFGSTKVKICPRCLIPVRYFKAEYNSRVYLKPLSATVAKKYAEFKRVTRLATDVAEQREGSENQQQEGMLRSCIACLSAFVLLAKLLSQ